MSNTYEPAEFEPKWQQEWMRYDVYSSEHGSKQAKTAYVLDMFPYPSGNSMHVGHPRGYVATDVYSRLKRMQGYRVLHPMGWDAFGLPAEETAIANQEYPSKTVSRNVDRFKAQLKRLGLSYDWKREINTTDPGYYKHTQLIFLEIFRRGLAYYDSSTVNWCPELGTVLANEDVVDGKSERGGFPVVQQPMRQWTLRITDYADRLIDDLDQLPNWPEKVKNAQTSWIGRSFGHEFEFETNVGVDIPVYTTRLDTLMGVTFIAVSPDSELAISLIDHAENRTEVERYIGTCKLKSDRERSVSKEKTGSQIMGVSALHPITKETLPVLVADYVLSGYGAGAVMGVPGHDERDAEFAKIFDFKSISVVADDMLVNSGEFNGLSTDQAQEALSERIHAREKKRFKIRDWVFSRQRFWGEPFPIVWVKGREAYERFRTPKYGDWLPTEPISYTDDGHEYFSVPVLPDRLEAVQLPIVESYAPTGEPSGPLAAIPEWVNAFVCPETGEVSSVAKEGMLPCKRETNTMPQWAGSSWYWLRYMDPANESEPFSFDSASEWGPVSVYAGADHAVAHLIYARFWHKILFDCGYVDFNEPFERLEFLGYVLASDGSKISKRKGNSRNPDEIIDQVGADAFRLYEMALGPFEKAVPWIDEHLQGQKRFLDRLWVFLERAIAAQFETTSEGFHFHFNTCLKKVTEDIDTFKFNTAVAEMMKFLNSVEKMDVSKTDIDKIVRMIAPFVPHFSEEIWSRLENKFSVHHAPWPKLDEDALFEEFVTIPIQIDGKRRTEIEVAQGATEESVRQKVTEHEVVRKWIEGREITRFIYRPSQIVNIVTR